jgi:lysophospholipase L1-like esterase
METSLRLLGTGAAKHDVRGLHEVRPDRPWLYGMRPNVDLQTPEGARYTINADGFRDHPYARPKPAGTFRIVVLGQSVAFGFGVPLEDTFPKLLERRLAIVAPEVRIEVLNLGVIGYNAYTEAALFADVGVGYEPDLVLVQFGFNDLNDPTLHFDSATMLRLGDIPDAAFPNPQRYPRPPRPSFGVCICNALRVCTLLTNLRLPTPDPGLLRASLQSHTDVSELEIAWLRARYGEIATAAGNVGARFAVVVFPYSAQLQRKVSDRVNERLAELGRETGWPVIDLLPALREAARRRVRIFIDPFHLTATGNRIVADTLAVELRCRGLLPLPRGRRCAPELPAVH